LCTVASALCGLIVPLARPGLGLGLYLLGTLTQVASIVAANIVMATFTQRYCPRAMLGRVAVTSRMVAFSAGPVGVLGAGVLASGLGVRAALWVLAASALSAVAVQLASPVARMRNLPSVYEQPLPEAV
jgi:hypothetical protein